VIRSLVLGLHPRGFLVDFPAHVQHALRKRGTFRCRSRASKFAEQCEVSDIRMTLLEESNIASPIGSEDLPTLYQRVIRNMRALVSQSKVQWILLQPVQQIHGLLYATRQWHDYMLKVRKTLTRSIIERLQSSLVGSHLQHFRIVLRWFATSQTTLEVKSVWHAYILFKFQLLCIRVWIADERPVHALYTLSRTGAKTFGCTYCSWIF
jgi:hypothetical protein